MLALAVLDRILSIDRQNQWLLYVCNSGYLRSLVESLRQDDTALQSLLTPQPPLLKPLYIYESKMALLTRVAKTGQGAVELLRCGLVAQLIECQVFDMVPDTDSHSGSFSGVYILLGVLEMGGEINSAALMEFQGHINRFQLCQGLVSGPGGVEKISSVQRSLLAKRRLVQFINNRAKLLALCSCILLAVELKGDMAAGFGEALQRKLLEVEGLYSQVRSRYTFIQALVRRIRGLLRQPKS
ncbi:hypothetical protein GOODEAATRI_006769 [Goodea atripinnis]|uniref:Uncharacterized protein n=1 Tax=Goodea atripinnis TaxID=208336 RepID=A0ABV0PC01_9TELE